MTTNGTTVTGHYVDVNGTRVFYDRCGNDGPLALFLHPAGTSSMQYFDLIQVLGNRGFRAVAIDLPGHGKSYPVNWTPISTTGEYADFVSEFLKTEFPGERAIVCGGAIGAGIAMELAIEHSDLVTATISLGGVAHAEGEQFTNYCRWWGDPHAMPGWRNFAERVAMSGVFGVAGERLKEFRWHHRYSAQEIGTADLLCWARHDVRDRLHRVASPVLVFKGEADYWTPEDALDWMVAHLPEGLAEKALGPGMGHYAAFEAPDSLADIFIDFLDRRGISAH